MELNDQFRRAYAFANETNQCIFLTGKAGTGKTTLLRYIKENCFKQISVLAPTGVAAIQAGGSTIHSFFQLPFSPFIPPEDKTKPSIQSNKLLGSAKLNNLRRSVMRQLDLLIIDEISMVRCDVLDAIDVMLRVVRRNTQTPFGGVQVMFIGDMYQLPPVVTDQEWQILSSTYASPFFFDAKVISEVHPIYIELDKIYRQNDQYFVDLLNKVRNNQLDPETIALLNTRYQPDWVKSDKTISLVTHNYMADAVNQEELAKLSGPVFLYQANVNGTFPEKAYPTDPSIELKVGARVMFVKNDTDKRYFNGKLGLVTELSEKHIMVLCDGENQAIEVKPDRWTNIQYKLDKKSNTIEEDEVGSFSQYPLRLAWAITIHKSQGLSFDEVEIDAEKAFSNGQVYVALSRCRTLEGIYLKSKINPYSLENHEKVVQFSERKLPANLIDVVLEEGKTKFHRKILLELFNFQEFVYQAQELSKEVHNQSLHLNSASTQWAEHWLNEWVELNSVCKKFELQLLQLLENPADSVLLQERLDKATSFFTAQLNSKLTSLQNCPLETESIETAKDLNPLIEELWRGIHSKLSFLKTIGKEFNLESYMKLKGNLNLPVCPINCYATRRKEDLRDIPHVNLYYALRELRDRICEEENMPIYLVANKKSLSQMCTILPESKEELLKISGFGKAKVEGIGPQFIEIIRNYVQEKGIEKSLTPPPLPKKGKENPKKATRNKRIRLLAPV